jgi:hypothetical protein
MIYRNREKGIKLIQGDCLKVMQDKVTSEKGLLKNLVKGG